MYNRVRKVLEIIEQAEDYTGALASECCITRVTAGHSYYRLDVHWSERSAADYFNRSLLVPGSKSRLLVSLGDDGDWLVQVWV